jgi:hypothetical protein
MVSACHLYCHRDAKSHHCSSLVWVETQTESVAQERPYLMCLFQGTSYDSYCALFSKSSIFFRRSSARIRAPCYDWTQRKLGCQADRCPIKIHFTLREIGQTQCSIVPGPYGFFFTPSPAFQLVKNYWSTVDELTALAKDHEAIDSQHKIVR